MKKRLLFIIGILLIIIVIGILFIKNNKKYPIIHYDYGVNKYDIVNKGKYLEVTKFDIIECIKAPCNPIKRGSFKVKNKKEYKELFERLLGKRLEINIGYSNDGDYDNKLLMEIVKEKETKKELYEIVEKSSSNSEYKKKGYYIEGDTVTIAMGEQGTGGYDIEVVNVNASFGDVQIDIEEIKPGENDVVTMALTYPVVRIKFETPINSVLIQDISSNTYYEEIKEDE